MNQNHTRHRIRAAAVAAASAGLLLAGCSASAPPAGGTASPPGGGTGTTYPLTIDNCGEELVIPSEPARVLTLGGSAIALLDAAGASDRITARAGEFGAGLPEGLSVPPTGAEIIDPADPSIEVIVGAEPDIIVGYGLFAASEEDVAAAGIPNVIVAGDCNHVGERTDRTDFETIFGDIARYGQIFDTRAAAEPAIEALRGELAELRESAADSGRGGGGESAAAVYYFSDSAALSAHGGLGITDEVLAIAGFENVYGEELASYLTVNIETLLEADPHTLVIVYGLYGESAEEARERVLAEPGTADLRAVREGRVIAVPTNDLTPDPGALRGLRILLEGTGAAEG